MRRILFQVVVFVFVGMAASSAASAQCNPNVESPIKCGYYNAGYQNGENDARANRSSNYRRYSNQYNRQYESAFRDGYQLGYSSAGGGGTRWTSSQRSAYDSGYSIGESDRRQGGFSRTPEQRGYDSNLALYFQQGYNDGFNNATRRYNFPIGNPGPLPGPQPPPWGGTGGSATWEGSVDDRANVIIRGSQITTRNISGNGITTRSQNVNGSIPRGRQVIVQVNKREGRGTVRVLQQPNRSNNYSAVIQIYDSRGGRDNYRIDVTWTSSGGNVEEPYRAGSVAWRGRVDQTVDIIITGDFVDSRDVSGSGMIVQSSRLTGYLAQRPGRVSASKRSGRGDVSVIQQPSRNNDYVAIIRISDTDSGADNYSVDIRW